MTSYPVSLNGMTIQNKPSWNIIKDQYGKPVLTPIRGADVMKYRRINDDRGRGANPTDGDDPQDKLAQRNGQ